MEAVKPGTFRSDCVNVRCLHDRMAVASQPVCPVCMPNRASLMTGRYPTQHGLRYNGCVLTRRANTFVEVLAESGYHTAAVGKSHLQPFLDKPPMRPPSQFNGPIAEAWKQDKGNYSQEEPGAYPRTGRSEFEVPYYGYQHVDMVTSHGDRCGGHYQEWFKEQAGDDWEALHDDANELPHNYTCPQAYRTPIPEELYPTSYIRDRAIDYLKGRGDQDEPFFLFVSFPDPHHPFNPPGKYWDMYSPDEFDVPVPYDRHVNPTPTLKWVYDNWQAGGGQLTPQTVTMIDEQEIKQAMALTAGMIAMVDDAVGDIMACLKDQGLDDDTVICFNADHGDYLGHFNMILKGAMPFQSITRVPFIWSDPANRNGGSTDVLASTIDIPATILDRAGVDPYNGIMGKSLVPVTAENAPLRDRLLVEYNDGGPRLGLKKPARVRSLLTDQYRITIYLDQDWGELYDLRADPDETHNLWDDPDHASVKCELSVALNHELARLMDESPLSNRLA